MAEIVANFESANPSYPSHPPSSRTRSPSHLPAHPRHWGSRDKTKSQMPRPSPDSHPASGSPLGSTLSEPEIVTAQLTDPVGSRSKFRVLVRQLRTFTSRAWFPIPNILSPVTEFYGHAFLGADRVRLGWPTDMVSLPIGDSKQDESGTITAASITIQRMSRHFDYLPSTTEGDRCWI